MNKFTKYKLVIACRDIACVVIGYVLAMWLFNL